MGHESDLSPLLVPRLRASGAIPPLATSVCLRGLHRDSFKFQLYIRRFKENTSIASYVNPLRHKGLGKNFEMFNPSLTGTIVAHYKDHSVNSAQRNSSCFCKNHTRCINELHGIKRSFFNVKQVVYIYICSDHCAVKG